MLLTLTALACALLVPTAAQAGNTPAPQCPAQHERITAVNQAQLETSLLCLTNVYRVENGLKPLKLDTRLAQASREHSEDMVARHFFDHVNPDGLDTEDRVQAAGFPGGAGENIAYASDGTIRTLFDAWRTSPGHNQNLLDPGYRSTGLGLAVGKPSGGQGVTGGQTFGLEAANTNETGGVEPGQKGGASAAQCAEAKRALSKKRKALNKAWLVAASSSRLQVMRAKVRRAKARVRAACA